MGKKFSKMSLLLWGGVLLAILFFVFGVGNVTEGYYSSCSTLGQTCSTDSDCCKGSCQEKINRQGKGTGKYICQT